MPVAANRESPVTVEQARKLHPDAYRVHGSTWALRNADGTPGPHIHPIYVWLTAEDQEPIIYFLPWEVRP